MLAHLPRPIAALIAIAFVAAGLWCFAAPPKAPAIAAPGQYTDLMLYRDVTLAVQTGEPYHQAATRLQRAHGYPTQPFVTVRLPTLYLALAKFGAKPMQFAALGLLLANLVAWAAALPAILKPVERIGALLGLVLAGAAIGSIDLLGFSELWCGLLLSLALALRLHRPERWWPVVLAVGIALAIRELALPFALLGAAFALWQRRWRELAAWGLLLALFAGGLVLHAQAVMAEIRPGDIVSPGWSAGQGLRGLLTALAYTTVWQQAPLPWAMLACLIPALGWLALSGRGAPFALLLLGGYALMLALFARPDNFYWGFVLLPAWFIGYALIPRALGQLVRAITAPPR
ncbi:MAG: hypothetical protein H6916_00140 [Novosphingobium sp.]|uniref:hypothetical protein n=1 Tax=Novosphingobium sp. TaxID=1874826 RepID=UPI002610EAC4|nr:hypothetical protein [Novosphingobium sp.]MCP5385209.1 hypothetical protein [Novosphingobium sp.]